MRLGLGFALDLYQEPRLELRQALECRVCRQLISEEGIRAGAVAALLPFRYAVCPCCRQAAPSPTDRNYRARARHWKAKLP